MAEDIDDLLDEVEDRFLIREKQKNINTKKKSNDRHTSDEDIDDLLNDITVDPLPAVQKNTTEIQSSNIRPDSARKCFPAYLGGAMCSKGMANSLNTKTCDKLRCTSCDFKVCSFDNFQWDLRTDYLFLRNNAPDYHRLKSNLIPKKGYRAYCCQCSFRSVPELTKLPDPTLKWVCGKH